MNSTVTTESACNLCGNDRASVLSTRSRSGAALRSVCCERCGLAWSDPRPHDARAFYEDEYRVAYKQTVEPKPKHVLRAGRVAMDRAGKIASLLTRPLRLLDVGSGGGEFAYLMQTLGHAVTGVEPNRGYAAYSEREYGLAVQRGLIGEADLGEASFDLITIWHVLEHTESPREVLAQLRRALRPDGHLVVEVPNVEATCQSPRSSFHEAHLFTFNPATLEAMGASAGLSLRSMAVSEDGGNLTAVFCVGAPRATASLAGNHGRVAAIVRGHTPLSHFLSAHPYRRFGARLARMLDEQATLRSGLTGRKLLDHLYAPHAGKLSLAPALSRPAPVFLPAALAAVLTALGLDQLILHSDELARAVTTLGAWAIYVLAQVGVLAALWVRLNRTGARPVDYAKVAGLALPLFLIPAC